MTGTWSKEGSKIATKVADFQTYGPTAKIWEEIDQISENLLSPAYVTTSDIQVAERLRDLLFRNSNKMPCAVRLSWLANAHSHPLWPNARCRHMRTAARGDRQVPATRTVTYGPRVPPSSETVFQTHFNTLHWQFCSRLKTHLFGLSYGSTSWLFRLLECAI